jgi:hypothetical protein
MFSGDILGQPFLSFNNARCAESNEACTVSDGVLAARRVTIEAGAFGSTRHSSNISRMSAGVVQSFLPIRYFVKRPLAISARNVATVKP